MPSEAGIVHVIDDDEDNEEISNPLCLDSEDEFEDPDAACRSPEV